MQCISSLMFAKQEEIEAHSCHINYICTHVDNIIISLVTEQ